MTRRYITARLLKITGKRRIRVKRKLFILAAALISLFTISGCSDYSEIEAELNRVTIENKLPEVSGSYASMEDAEDAVYEQQIAACEMLSDSYLKTNAKTYTENFRGNEKRVAESCNNKRNEINADIMTLYSNNIYKIMEDVGDCENVDAYVSKTRANVDTFYDEYYHYKTADNQDVALTDILVYYYDRRNILAKSFLARNEKKVFDASLAVIEGNAQTDDEFRFYINKNNTIIKALNEIFGGVPKEYAEKISAAGDKLAINLLNSLESLSERERKALIEEMGLASPTPSPKPTASPTQTPEAKPSEAPVTPSPTQRPTAAPTQKPAAPTQKPAPAPTQTPSEPNASSGSGDDDNAVLQYIIDF